jgi:hypothetical protein
VLTALQRVNSGRSSLLDQHRPGRITREARRPLRWGDMSGRLGHKAPMSAKDDADGPAKEPEWLTRLSGMAARAPNSHRKHRDAKWGSSSGAANKGQRLLSWSCTCGWTGAAQDLKPGAGGISCPACGSASGLTSTQARNV